METEITLSQLDAFRRAVQADPMAKAAAQVLSRSPMKDVTFDGRSQRQMTHHFSLEIPTMEACDQQNSGRCWLFAALNLLREQVGRDLQLPNFELSQNYLCFYDHLEKANSFLQQILETAHLPLDDRRVTMLLKNPIGDGGWWEYFQGLYLKYGICPREAMPDTWQSSHTEDMNQILSMQLRKDALELRRQARAGEETLNALRDSMLRRVYRVLTICLGTPPDRFDFTYTDKDGTYHRDPELTPLEFSRRYLHSDPRDLVSILNAPLPDVPYYTTCCTLGEQSIYGDFLPKRLNLPLEEFKAAVLRQLQAGEPVWFVCDSDYYEGRTEGIWDPSLYGCSQLLGLSMELSKGELLQLRQTSLNHAMVFTGADLQGGRKWKIQNSWGTKAGRQGYYVCSDAWFDRYVYSAVISRKYLTEAQQQAFLQPPQILPPWHVLG